MFSSDFTFNKGVHRGTVGSHLSEPIECGDNDDKVIMVMDCQGFKGDDTDCFYTTIAAIISSHVIWNVLYDDLTEIIKSAVEKFDKVLDDDFKGQNLVKTSKLKNIKIILLINIHTFNYLFYFQIVVIRDCPDSIRSRSDIPDLENLEKYFENVDAVFLRLISAMVEKREFVASFKQLNQSFKTSMERFFEYKMCPNGLETKFINIGNEKSTATCADIVPVLESFANLFETNLVPDKDIIRKSFHQGVSKANLERKKV